MFESQNDHITRSTIDPTNIHTNLNQSCLDCGLLFVSTMDLQKHIKRGCPEDDDKLTNKKGGCNNEDDTSVWYNLKGAVYKEYNDTFTDKVDTYMEEGASEKNARQKASTHLFSKYVKRLMNMYQETIFCCMI